MTSYQQLLTQTQQQAERHDFIAIVGATASGKTALALRLQRDLDAEIIACDSVQVYRGFDIGSAKPSAQIRAQAPHHLIDCANCEEDYNAGRYYSQARDALAGIRKRGKVALVVGGCGLYLRALMGHGWHHALPSNTLLRAQLNRQSTVSLYAQLQALAPHRADQVHCHDRIRIHRALELAILLKEQPCLDITADKLQPYVIYLSPERSVLRRKIFARTQMMLENGLIDEVKELQTACGSGCKPLQSIGYRQVLEYLRGEFDQQTLATKISIATCQYAKRQATWFNNRSMLPNVTRVCDVSP